ncbi:MAG TPA: WD40 repeat domain-containing protein [Jiangellaceae bacterium]|nr:WD40 repeat domain-containing protein [Jiangellaceae bacterium]
MVDADRVVAVATVGAEPPQSSRSPYPGLAAFGRSDADLFFGRERIVKRCLELLRTERFVAVVGVSGSGTSSVLHGGLVPRLGDVVQLRPGERPLQAFADAGVADRPDALLVVDQLEDVVTLCQGTDDRAAFLGAIVDHPGGLAVALRANHYGDFASYQEFAQLLSSCHVLLGPLDDEQLDRAIEEPARRCGLDVEDGLPELIAAELEPSPGALPALGQALRETWLRRDGRTLTIAGYRDAGGVRSAIAQTAERVYGALQPAEQRVARRLLLRMVHRRTDGDLRRWISDREVAEVDPNRGPAVISAFATAGLIVTERAENTIAHEAVLSSWPRLADWIDREPAAGLGRRRVPDERGTVRRLSTVAIATSVLAVTALAVGIVAVAERNNANEERNSASEERDAAQQARLIADARASAIEEPDAALLLAAEARSGSEGAASAAALVDTLLARPSARALLQGSPFAVEALAVGAGTVIGASGNEVRRWTADGWEQTGGYEIGDAEIADVALSTDGTTLVVASPDGRSLVAVDAATGQPVVDPVSYGAMSPVGVVASGDRVLVVVDDRVNPAIASRVEQRDLRTLDPAGPTLIPPQSRLEDVVVSDDGRRAAMSTADGAVWLADLGTGQVVLGAPAPASEEDVGLDALAWHADLLVGGRIDGSVDAWRTDPGVALTQIGGFAAGGPVEAVATGCDGGCLAAGTADGRVVAWRIGAEGHPLDVPQAHDGRVNAVEFTGDGAYLISAGADRLTMVHALDGSLMIARTATSSGAPARGAYGAGNEIISGTDDVERGRITRHSPTGEVNWRTPVEGAVTWLATTDARVVALVQSADQTMRFMVLDAGTGGIVLDHPLAATRATGSVSADGTVVLLATRDASGSLLSTVDLGSLSMSEPTKVGDRVTAVAISPDSSRILTGHSTGDVALRDPESFTPERRSASRLDNPIGTVGFTPDGTAVFAGGRTGVVEVMDTTTLEPQFAPLEGHRRVVTGSAANDRLILTASEDGTVRIWDLTSGAAVGGPVPTGGTMAPSIAMSTDGNRALVQSDRGLLELIADEDEWVRLACTLAGRELTAEERTRYGLDSSARACASQAD